MLGNVKMFLWRTLYLQGIRRHYFATAIEILLVGLIFILLMIDHKPAKPLSRDSEEVDASSAFVPSIVTDIVYAPKNDYNERLMLAVAGEIYSRLGRKVLHDLFGGSHGSFGNLSFDKKERGAPNVGSFARNDVPKKAGYVKLHPKNSADAVINECKKLMNDTYLLFMPFIPLCVTLFGPENQSASLAMTLYAPVRFVTAHMVDFGLGSFQKAEQSFNYTVIYQQIIEEQYLKLQSEHYREKPVDHQVSIDVMPGWVFKGFEDPYQLGLFAVIYFAFLLPVVRRISAIQHEFTTGIACLRGRLTRTSGGGA